MTLYKLIIALTLMASVQAYAQEEKINTDQPDQSVGSSVIEKRSFQLETTLYINHFKTAGTAVVSSNSIRAGIIKGLEARLLVEQGHNRDLYIDESAHGTSPLAVGAKMELQEESRKRPALSVMAGVQVPVTNHEQPHIWSPSLTVIAEKHLADFTVTINGTVREAAFEKACEWQPTTDIRYDISSSLSVFGEYFAQFQVHEHPLHNIDGGLLYAISKKVQVHIAAGSSIFYKPGNYFVNTGLAFNLKG